MRVMHYAASKAICANVHTTRAKAKYAHNHVTAESAQPKKSLEVRQTSPVLWVGSGTRLSTSTESKALRLRYSVSRACAYAGLFGFAAMARARGKLCRRFLSELLSIWPYICDFLIQ